VSYGVGATGCSTVYAYCTVTVDEFGPLSAPFVPTTVPDAPNSHITILKNPLDHQPSICAWEWKVISQHTGTNCTAWNRHCVVNSTHSLNRHMGWMWHVRT